MGYAERYDSSKVFQGHTLLTFNNKLQVKFLDVSIPLCDLWVTNGSISDEEGNLLFFTDGHRVYGKHFDLCFNGDSINPGELWENFNGFGYPEQNGALFLPFPGRRDEYVLFHKGVTYDKPIPGREDNIYCNIFYYSVLVDNERDNGEMRRKNVPLLKSYINDSEMAACKHGNGRDYWIVIKTMGTREYYFYLLDSSGVRLSHTQVIGTAKTKNDWNGNSVFSRDGSKFARVLPEDGLEIFDFDRCKGQFSNPRHADFPDAKLLVSSVAFSGSGRFVYVSSINKIWQYDLEAVDVGASEVVILSRDTFTSPLDHELYNKGYFQMRLAPDNMIYVVFFGGNHFMTRIRQPDNKGIACKAVNYDIILPAWMGGSLPLYPNFRLGVLQGSACDNTNSVVEVPYDENKRYNALSVFAISGELIGDYKNKTIQELRSETSLIPGLYFVRISHHGFKTKTFKLIF